MLSYIYIPRTQITTVLNGKGRLVMGCWPLKIEVSWVLGISFYHFRSMLFEYNNICVICVRNSSWHRPPLEQMETFIFPVKSLSMELSGSAKFYLQTNHPSFRSNCSNCTAVLELRSSSPSSVSSTWSQVGWGVGRQPTPGFFVAGRKGHPWISPVETCKHVIWRSSGNLQNR